MRTKIFIYIISVLFCSFSLAQSKFSNEIENDFNKTFEKFRNEWKVPGIAVGIIKDGKVIFAKGFGYRDVKDKLPVTPNTVFAIGSCTKSFTAASVAMLVERGLLDWDKPLINYLKDFRMYNDYLTTHITTRDILTHRTGLPRHDLVWYGSDLSRKEIYHKLRYLEPNKDLRETFQYNNLMYLTAGVLIEELTGLTWEEFVTKNIFENLDMKNIYLRVKDVTASNDYSLPYDEKNDTVKKIQFYDGSAIAPAGAIHTSVNELLKWLEVNIDSGKYNGKEIIAPNLLTELHRPQTIIPGSIYADELFYNNYGMGWFVSSYRGHVLVSHGGNINGFTAHLAMLPRDNIGIVVLANVSITAVNTVIRNYVMDKLLGLNVVDWDKRFKDYINQQKQNSMKANKEEKVEETTASHPLKDYTGTYTNPGYGKIIITQDGNVLKGKFHTFDFTLQQYKYDIFKTDNEDLSNFTFSFKMNDKGEITTLSVPFEPSVKDIEFDKE